MKTIRLVLALALAANADGSGRTRLTESSLFEPPQNSVAPEWSPVGEWIAFLTDRRGDWKVCVMRTDGSEQQPLFPPDALEGIEFHYEAQSEHVLDWWMPPSASVPQRGSRRGLRTLHRNLPGDGAFHPLVIPSPWRPQQSCVSVSYQV